MVKVNQKAEHNTSHKKSYTEHVYFIYTRQSYLQELYTIAVALLLEKGEGNVYT